jgi:hypothetical protein
MALRGLDFWIAVSAAAVLAAGGALQTAKAAAAAQPVPDFSGFWAHPSVGYNGPLSGPGPILNKSRLPSGKANAVQLVGDYTNPILKPEAAATLKKMGEISMSGLAFPDPDNQCLQNPLPYIFWNFDIQLLQEPNKVTIIYQHDEDFREIRLNQPHPAKIIPSVHGDSVGHYEGDTLVVDTVGIKAGPYRTVDRFGTPYTDAIHVVERYRLVDYETAKAAQDRAEIEWPRAGGDIIDRNYRGKGLQLEFRVEDPGTFTMPWSGTQSYLRAARTGFEERICAENVSHYYEARYYSDPNAHIPTAGKPDF